MNKEILLNLAIAILMGSITAYLAKGRGRSPYIWFLVGMFLGLIGLLILFLIPATKFQAPGGGGADQGSSADQNSSSMTIETDVQEVKPHPPMEIAYISPLLANDGWFYLDKEKKQQGPNTLKELEDRYTKEAISENSYVWCEGMSEWKRIRDIEPLISRLNSAREHSKFS